MQQGRKAARKKRSAGRNKRKPTLGPEEAGNERIPIHNDRYGSFKRLSWRLRCLSISPVAQYSLRTARSASS